MKNEHQRAQSLTKEGLYPEAEEIWRQLSRAGSLEASIELAAVLERQTPGSEEAGRIILDASAAIENTDCCNHYLIYLAMCYRDIGDIDFVKRQTQGYRHLALAAAPPDGLPMAMIEMATSYARGTVAFERNFVISEKWYRLAAMSDDKSVRQDAIIGLKELERLRRKVNHRKNS